MKRQSEKGKAARHIASLFEQYGRDMGHLREEGRQADRALFRRQKAQRKHLQRKRGE